MVSENKSFVAFADPPQLQVKANLHGCSSHMSEGPASNMTARKSYILHAVTRLGELCVTTVRGEQHSLIASPATN